MEHSEGNHTVIRNRTYFERNNSCQLGVCVFRTNKSLFYDRVLTNGLKVEISPLLIFKEDNYITSMMTISVTREIP